MSWRFRSSISLSRLAVTAAVLNLGACGSVRSDAAQTCGAERCVAGDAGVVVSPNAGVPEPVDGSRLTRNGVDTLRGVPCRPGRTADGKTRCVPTPGGSVGPSPTFVDPACTRRIGTTFGIDPCSGPPPFFSELEGDADPTCGGAASTTRTYQVLGSIPTPRVTYAQGPGDTCDGSPLPITDVVVTFFEVVEVDPADSVALEREDVAITDALSVSFWVGDDGSRQFDAYRLSATGVACAPFPEAAPGTVSHCLPKVTSTFAASGLFAETCETPALARIDCDGVLANLTPPAGAAECGAPPDLHELSPIPLAELRELEGASCVPAFQPRGGESFRIGAAVRLDDYPELEVTLEGSGRLREARLTSEGRTVGSLDMYDTELGGFCRPVPLEDGVTYCVGAGTFSMLTGGTFTDPGCSLGAATFRAGCRSEPPVAVLVGPSSPCAGIPTFLHHTLHEGPIYGFTFADPPGCAEIPREADTLYYAPGDPRPPDAIFARSLTPAPQPPERTRSSSQR